MDIRLNPRAERGWLVELDRCAVPFSSREEAERFVERLRQRLAAPHRLPLRDADGRLAPPLDQPAAALS